MTNTNFIRVLGRTDVLALAFGAMIGWGWVVLTQNWILEAGTLGAMLAFAIGGAVVVLVGLVYAELTAAMPKVGGEHVFAFRGLGITASFICTWAIILGYLSVAAFESVALPTVLEYLVPNYGTGLLWTVAGWDVHASWAAVGIGGSLTITTINYFGVKPAAFLQTVFTVVILLAGLLLISGSLLSGASSTANLQPLVNPGMKGLFSVVVMTPFMFIGFNVIPQTAEEINLPFKAIGSVLVLSVVMAVVWYIMVILGVGVSLDNPALAGSTLATAAAMDHLFSGTWAGKFLIFAGVAGILTSWNSFYLGASRAIYAMSHANMLPRLLGKLHPRYKTPQNAIALIGALTSLAPLFGKKMMIWLVDAGGLGIAVAWVFVSVTFVVLRFRQPQMRRPFRVRNGKPLGVLCCVFSVGLAMLYLPGSPSALLWPHEWGIVLTWAALGLVFYLHTHRAYGRSSMVQVLTEQAAQ